MAVIKKAAIISVGKILCENKFSFHLDIYQGAQLLDLMSMFGFVKTKQNKTKKTTKPSSKLAAFPPAVNESTCSYQHLVLSVFWILVIQITADGDCSHEIKRRLLLGRKVMTNLDSILKSRDITLPTKVRLVKAMVFPVVMYERESWTVKKAEC